VGSFTPATATLVSLEGAAAVGQVGAFLASLSKGLTGVQAIAQVGSFTVTGVDVNVSLVGVAATGQVGSFTPIISSSVIDVDAVLTKKQLDALRKRLKRSRYIRDAEDEKRRKYTRDLKTSIEELYAKATGEQREEIAAVLPKAYDDKPRSQEASGPLETVDWNAFILSQNAIGQLRKILSGLAIAIAEAEAQRRFEEDEEDVAILAMVM
jgi:ribosomal protein S9